MAKSERIKELEKEYEAASLILFPKGKSGSHSGSVPMKELESLEKCIRGTIFRESWRLSRDEIVFVSE